MRGDDRIYTQLAELRDRIPRLGDALAGGTPRRWQERDLTTEQREQQDARALQERAYKEWNATRGFSALGDGRAPLDLSVLDAIAGIEAGVVAVETTVCEWLALTPLVGASPQERITRLIGLLTRIEALDDLAAWVDTEAARLNRWARRAIGDAEPVHKIRARCPVCDAMSLRAFPERETVCCVNDACRCGDQSCGCNAARPRRHRWPYEQWAWLARVLDNDLRNEVAS